MQITALRGFPKLIAIALCAISTTGCSSLTWPEMFGGASQRTTTYVPRCPALKSYTAEQQRSAAAEIRAMPAGAVVPVMINDYGTLRSRCRAMQER